MVHRISRDPQVQRSLRYSLRDGVAWYLATRVDATGTAALVRRLCADTGVTLHEHPGVEIVRRHGESATYLFVINHTDAAAEVAAQGVDLVSGADCPGTVKVGAGEVAVVREGGR